MKRTLVIDTLKNTGQTVLLEGFVNTVRDHGKITFLDLRDSSGIIQCVGTDLPKLSPESVISITGEVKERPEKMVNKNIPTGSLEIAISSLRVLSKAEELPFDMGKEKLDLQLPTLLDYRTLTLRHPRVSAIFRVQEAVMNGFRIAAKELGCVEIFTPTIAASSTEGGAEVFKVKYYDYDAFLIQSPQLYKQMLVPVFERVFLVSHAYRAEPSVTTRHLSESTQMDCELAYLDFPGLMDALEFVGRETLRYVEKTCSEELKLYGVEKLKLTNSVPRLTMREAQKIILDRTGVDHTKEKDLMPEDEREICKWALEEKGSDLVTITHYPTKKRAFYTMPDPDNPEFSLSYDLLFRGVEILSGSQRINDYKELMEAIKDREMDPKDFEMYLQAFKYGMPPEGGFSFGLERMTMQLLKLDNIREASLYPRDMERVDIRLSTLIKTMPDTKAQPEIFNKILDLLDKRKVTYDKYEHEPVFTSEDSAKVRGTTVHQGAKALVIDTGKSLALFVLPADLKADLEKLKNQAELKKAVLASKETVKAKTGLEVGSVPPFGSLMGLKTYVDSRMAENDEIAFNAGRHDRSLKMKYEDFVKLEKPEIISI